MNRTHATPHRPKDGSKNEPGFMTDTDSRSALKPGFKIHWHEIIRVLGQGGFGISYLSI